MEQTPVKSCLSITAILSDNEDDVGEPPKPAHQLSSDDEADAAVRKDTGDGDGGGEGG